MSKTPPINQPFFVVVRRRHADAGLRQRADACAVALALDEALPDYAGSWRVNSMGASLMNPASDSGVLGQWAHDAFDAVTAFDLGKGMAPDLRVRFRPLRELAGSWVGHALLDDYVALHARATRKAKAKAEA